MMYLIKGQCSEYKRNLNQLKMRHTEERRVIVMEIFYDMFEVPALRDIEPYRTS